MIHAYSGGCIAANARSLWDLMYAPKESDKEGNATRKFRLPFKRHRPKIPAKPDADANESQEVEILFPLDAKLAYEKFQLMWPQSKWRAAEHELERLIDLRHKAKGQDKLMFYISLAFLVGGLVLFVLAGFLFR
jgi:hypothetical protein